MSVCGCEKRERKHKYWDECIVYSKPLVQIQGVLLVGVFFTVPISCPPPPPPARLPFVCLSVYMCTRALVPVGSPSRGGDVTVHVKDTNQPSLPTPFYSVLVSISVFMALSTVFHSINYLDNSPFCHPVLPVLFLPYWTFQMYISLYESLLQP